LPCDKLLKQSKQFISFLATMATQEIMVLRHAEEPDDDVTVMHGGDDFGVHAPRRPRLVWPHRNPLANSTLPARSIR